MAPDIEIKTILVSSRLRKKEKKQKRMLMSLRKIAKQQLLKLLKQEAKKTFSGITQEDFTLHNTSCFLFCCYCCCFSCGERKERQIECVLKGERMGGVKKLKWRGKMKEETRIRTHQQKQIIHI